jgi:hypothetical protein
MVETGQPLPHPRRDAYGILSILCLVVRPVREGVRFHGWYAPKLFPSPLPYFQAPSDDVPSARGRLAVQHDFGLCVSGVSD